MNAPDLSQSARPVLSTDAFRLLPEATEVSFVTKLDRFVDGPCAAPLAPPAPNTASSSAEAALDAGVGVANICDAQTGLRSAAAASAIAPSLIRWHAGKQTTTAVRLSLLPRRMHSAVSRLVTFDSDWCRCSFSLHGGVVVGVMIGVTIGVVIIVGSSVVGQNRQPQPQGLATCRPPSHKMAFTAATNTVCRKVILQRRWVTLPTGSAKPCHPTILPKKRRRKQASVDQEQLCTWQGGHSPDKVEDLGV